MNRGGYKLQHVLSHLSISLSAECWLYFISSEVENVIMMEGQRSIADRSGSAKDQRREKLWASWSEPRTKRRGLGFWEGGKIMNEGGENRGGQDRNIPRNYCTTKWKKSKKILTQRQGIIVPIHYRAYHFSVRPSVFTWDLALLVHFPHFSTTYFTADDFHFLVQITYFFKNLLSFKNDNLILLTFNKCIKTLPKIF